MFDALLQAGSARGRAAVEPRGLGAAVRRSPIRMRILAIAVLNSALALVLLVLIWNGAQVLGHSWADLRQVRQSERFLTSLGGDADRLQSLIHRYFAQSQPEILSRIIMLSEMLVSRLRVQARLDPLISEPARGLTPITEGLINGFEDLRQTRAEISHAYTTQVVKIAGEMAELYGALARTMPDPNSVLSMPIGESREAFNAMILAANAFYLSGSAASAQEAESKAGLIRQVTPALLGSEDPNLARILGQLSSKAEIVERGIKTLTDRFAEQSRLLNVSIDQNATAMSNSIDTMRSGIDALERSAQTRFDRTLEDVAVKLAVLAVAFVALVALMSVAIARSISEPLGELRADMTAVMTGDFEHEISGLRARDEIGEMARAVAVFRRAAIAKREVEADLRAAKERAETSLAEIREMQRTLIEAEKLAALGGLVAGVAHEVNNPVGISLTVASSLARRSEAFEAEMASGQLRRSRLSDFTQGTKLAATQLVANLQRAAELIQSFKQVAVDRSQAERRHFDLGQATEQILASLRPSFKTSQLKLVVDIPDGIMMDSFAGPLGQILTNLLLNAANHAFPGGEPGTISIVARISGQGQIRMVVRDDGRGMSEEVQRKAFDPFFTTRRGQGGTGLGLHIVYNLVTQRLGGRIVLSSAEGSGTSFLVVLPIRAPDDREAVAAPRAAWAGGEGLMEARVLMENGEDIVAFVDEEPFELAKGPLWKVLIVDDDPAVHEGTRFALYDYALAGHGLELLSAYSAAEGRALLAAHPDAAVILLDVVMETEGAGLDLVDHIRKRMRNETVRIILRTGQPGQAPERNVIVDYDINDYKAKTELTSDKLFTSLTAALRSYQQLQRMMETRRGLEIIIEAASTLFDLQSMQRLAEGVLTQIASLMGVDCAGILVLRDDGRPDEHLSILAGSGCYRQFVGSGPGCALDGDLMGAVRQAFDRRRHEFLDSRSVIYLRTGSGREVVVLLETDKNLSETNRTLVEVFCARLAVAFDNVILYKQLEESNLRLEDRVAKRTAELRNVNRRLAVQSGELRRANRFKSEILGTIAHDLKNPLGVIMGRSEMLSDLLAMQPLSEEAIRAQVAHVRDSARRLTGMVDALINDAMRDALDISVRQDPFDLTLIANDVVEANRPLADRKDQDLALESPDSLVVCGDHDRIWEAIDNLVSNAVKYSPVGGRVRVELAAEPDAAVIRVCDSGPGLSPEDAGRIFGRFQRLSAKPTAGESSTGLGLSIAKRIVDLHRGRIEAANAEPGPGAVFTISLPRTL